jgi:hypothetical protein
VVNNQRVVGEDRGEGIHATTRLCAARIEHMVMVCPSVGLCVVSEPRSNMPVTFPKCGLESVPMEVVAVVSYRIHDQGAMHLSKRSFPRTTLRSPCMISWVLETTVYIHQLYRIGQDPNCRHEEPTYLKRSGGGGFVGDKITDMAVLYQWGY